MTIDADDISIGPLEEVESDAASEVYLATYPIIRRLSVQDALKSWDFFLASAISHGLLTWLCSASFLLRTQLLLALGSLLLQALYLVVGSRYLWRYPPYTSNLHEHWSQPHRRFLVARDKASGGRIVGTIALERRDNLSSALFCFCVVPKYQCKGIGGLLNKEAERIAREEFGSEKLVLQTSPFLDSGLAFYKKHGHKYTSTLVFPFPYLWYRFRAVRYEKVL